MLDLFVFLSTSQPSHLSISPSINEVRSVAMSNVDGFTPNHLLQQIYGTQLLDQDVDLKLSDEELELIASQMPQCESSDSNCVVSINSDVSVGGKKIIEFDNFPYNQDQHQQINYIMNAFAEAKPPIRRISKQTAGIISNHLRATAPIDTKRAHCGFTIDLPPNPDTPVDVRYIGC